MKKRLLLTASLLSVLFIFMQSCMSGSNSAEESGRMLALLLGFFERMQLPFGLTEYILRKLAHFTEFGVFGFFTAWTVSEYSEQFRKNVFTLLFILLAIPTLDETLQYFSPERSPLVTDVLIDFSGGLCGAALIISILHFVISRKKQAK